MASSRVMASSSSANSDFARQSSLFSPAVTDLQSSAAGDPIKTLRSMSMEDLLRNIYPENAAPFAGEDGAAGEEAPASASREGNFPQPKEIASRTVDEVWREIAAGRKGDGGKGSDGEMTLEDFLARAGAVREEEVRVPSGSGQGNFGLDSVLGGDFGQQQQLPLENPVLGFGNGVEGGGGRGGRRRKRLMLDPVDRVVLQRQKRMIKNRESAARSRERKQAYTVELESLVTQLEEENARLLKYQEEQHKERLQQLMENVIPVTENKKPKLSLRRTCSMHW
ncbi:bZIP transcription factor 12-like isoform X1 [Phoenix dactylifera]|uniref:BZIP transcription factor 12-like isoform X1 n=1 Tax=Phoenix dactylifera TaxID=42345 RepID=A0A8B7C8M8_PHODC|nr:bZIP transcription factor 12-like isoform X1 [Phoenix dactylifera]